MKILMCIHFKILETCCFLEDRSIFQGRFLGNRVVCVMHFIDISDENTMPMKVNYLTQRINFYATIIIAALTRRGGADLCAFNSSEDATNVVIFRVQLVLSL